MKLISREAVLEIMDRDLGRRDTMLAIEAVPIFPSPAEGVGPSLQPQPAPVPQIKAGWTMLVCEPDGTIVTVRDGVLTQLPIRGQSASWSLKPGGGIVFAASLQLMLADSDGLNVRRIKTGWGGVVMPQQASDGRIVFMGDRGGAFLVNEDGSELLQALPSNTSAPGAPQHMQPTLSPDGTRIAFVKQTDDPYSRQVWTMDIKTGLHRQETFRGDDPSRPDANAPMYLPNGDIVCFNGVEAPQHPGPTPQSPFTLGQRDIALLSPWVRTKQILTKTYPATSEAQLEAMTEGTFIAADDPTPSPDGQEVIFNALMKVGRNSIRAVTGIVNIDGTGQRPYYYPSGRGVVRQALR